MKKVTYNQIRQQFISRLLATFSIASLVLLPLQFLPWGLRRPIGEADTLTFHWGFPVGAPYWWTDIVPRFLLVTLVLTAVFSLLNLRLLKKSQKTPKAAVQEVAVANTAGSEAWCAAAGAGTIPRTGVTPVLSR
jgi:hypothetical protein